MWRAASRWWPSCGQAENLIKMHKVQLASDRTSCQSPVANQVRLVLHTAASWLMLGLRDAIPAASPLARAEFTTLRLRLLKLGARVVEKAARIRIHFASACPDAALVPMLAGRLAQAVRCQRRIFIPTVMQFGYGRSGIGGYLGDVGSNLNMRGEHGARDRKFIFGSDIGCWRLLFCRSRSPLS
jgi:hypothetical protein